MQELHSLLRTTSRTFAAGIEALPGELRDAVTLAYLVLRVSDYFEDSPNLPPSEKRRCLDAWADLVGGVRDGSGDGVGQDGLEGIVQAVSPEDRALPDRTAALEAGAILTALDRVPTPLRGPIREHTAATTRGMSEWCARGDDFPDEAALDAYMFEVAGRVGLLLTELFAATSPGIRRRAPALRRLAVSFGLGLQTVNVIRGLHEDPGRGWTFVPRHLLPSGAPSADVRSLAPGDQDRILDFLVRKSGRHIADGLEYCRILPRSERGIRVFCVIPALLALATARLSAGNREVFVRPVKLTRAQVRRTVLSSELVWFSNAWLGRARRMALELAEGSGDASR